MATIARLVTIIEAQMEGFDNAVTTFERVGKSGEDLIGTVKNIGKALGVTFALKEVVQWGEKMLEFAGHMKDLSDRTGIGVERIQGLAIAASEGGVQIDSLANSMGMLSKNLVGGSPGVVEALRLMGLNLKGLLAESPDQRLFDIAKGFEAIEDPAMRAWAAQQLFGRSGNELIPILTKNLEELTKQYEKGAIPKETIERADQLEESIKRLITRTEALVFTVGVSLVDAFQNASMDMDTLSASEQRLAEQMADNGLAGAIEQANKGLRRFHAEEMPSVAVTMEEAARITKDLTEKTRESIKAHEEQARWVEKTETAYRSLTNWIEEQYIESIKKQIAETERMRSEMIRIETDFTNEYLGELQKRNAATQASLDAEEAEWRQYQNAVGLILMEQDRLAMQTTQSIAGYFKEMFSSMWEGIDTTMMMVDDLFGNKLSQAQNNWSRMWRGAQQEMHGMTKLMRGDITGLVDMIKGAIDWVGGLWNALKGLFGGGEEGVVVNPARDTFLSQWGDPSNKGTGGAGWNLAALLTELGAGEGGGSIFAALQKADTMALFRPAAQAIVSFLNQHGQNASMNFHSGGMVPGTGEVPAMLLGGERVQSRGEVADMGGLLTEFRDLKYRLMNAIEVSPSQMRAQAQIQIGLGASA